MNKLFGPLIVLLICLTGPSPATAQCAPVLAWPSALLTARPVTHGTRAGQIVDALLESGSPLAREVQTFQKEHAIELWDLYFQIYDGLVRYSPGYLDIFARANRALPDRGRIGDYGYGTGNGLVSLHTFAPERLLVGTEPSPVGRARALEKVKANPDLRADLNDQRFFDYDPGDQALDGAILINVLYALPSHDRLEALRRIHRHLRPHARLVISDPAKLLQDRKSDVIRQFAYQFFAEAIQDGARPIEHELALFAYLNIHTLIGTNTFLSEEELQTLAREAGFAIREHSTSYYGVSHFVVLERL